jgi:hypothetical protein
MRRFAGFTSPWITPSDHNPLRRGDKGPPRLGTAHFLPGGHGTDGAAFRPGCNPLGQALLDHDLAVQGEVAGEIREPTGPV